MGQGHCRGVRTSRENVVPDGHSFVRAGCVVQWWRTDLVLSYRTAFGLTPDDPEIMMSLANTLELMGRTEETDELRHMIFLLILRNRHE